MSERRTVAITGAGGFVCSHLAEGLAARGHTVVALDQRFDTATRARLSACTLVECAVAECRARDAFAGCDLLIAGAALTTEPSALGLSKAAHIKTNLALLLDALDAAEAQGVGEVIFLSSSGVFEPDDALEMTTEQTRATGGHAYALAKLTGEALVDARGGTILRLGPLYGPHETARESRQGVSLVKTLCNALDTGTPVTLDTPQRRRDWTYVRDLAPAIDHLLGAGGLPGGIVHCGTREIVSDYDLAARILGTGNRVRLAAGPQTAKAPMASVRPEFADFGWTRLEDGLAQTMTRQAVLA